MKYIQFIIYLWLAFASPLWSQKTHVIEPSNIEIRYVASYEGDYKKTRYKMGSNTFIFRCGKTTSQYFCHENLRHDSLSHCPSGFDILYNEIMAGLKDDSKRPTYTPAYSEFSFRNLSDGAIATYCGVMGEHFIIKDSLTMDWEIINDSVTTIAGHECYLAETNFRGRHWRAWYAPDIPLQLGPWKFCGLPGMILKAESPDFLNIECYQILTRGLTPVKFYNYYGHKYGDAKRTDYIKMKADPSRYPKGTYLTPLMELE